MIDDYKLSEVSLNQDVKKTEQRCLFITSIFNISLSVVEIAFYFLVGSTSILFDGIFSIVMTLTSIIALLLGIFIKKNSFNYPFGKSIYDNIFSLFKGLLLIALCIYFLVDASIILYEVTNHILIPEDYNNKDLYIIYISVACGVSVVVFLIYFYYSKKLNHKSNILKVEIKSSIMDFSISFAVGIALLVSSFTVNSPYVLYVVDKSLTIVLVTIMLPINIKHFINELMIISGYRMYKDEEKELMNHLNMKCISDIYIQRHNAQKIFMITIKCDAKTKSLYKIKQEITNHIYEHYSKDTKIYFLV